MRKILLFLAILFTVSIAYSKEIEVLSMTLAKQVKNRIPEAIGDEVPNNIGRVYLWTKIKTKNPPTYIYHVWYYKNREVARIRLYIKYPVFRTWSFKTIPSSWEGNWRVKVEDANGNVIAEKHFKVVKVKEDKWE